MTRICHYSVGQPHTNRASTPLILTGGKNLGFKHGQFLRYGEPPNKNIPMSDAGYRTEMDYEELPLSNLYLTMLHKLGVDAKSFADSDKTLSEI